MSEIEKKYSDLQKSDCDAQELSGPSIDEKICPTCEEDPNFKLEAQWFEISEAYLNKKVCEYHVRVYEGEVNQELDQRSSNDTFEDVLLEIAALRILRDFDKPINASTKMQVKNAAAMIDRYYGSGSRMLGTAFLVSTPAFNFDQILPNDDENAESNDEATEATGGEFILNAKGLNRKLIILKFTLETYANFYSAAQHVDDSFVIRQKDDIVYRLNYRNVSEKLKIFRDELNRSMAAAGYARINELGLFKTKRPKRIKIVLDESGSPFQLKDIYVLPDNGCTEKYEKIHLLNSAKSPDMAVIYSLLKNLDRAYNDITAKETKPWLEWTLEYLYPEYIVDRGSLENVDDVKDGLQCLLEEQLGVNNAALDSLAREIMSAFTVMEKEYDKQSCRELDRIEAAKIAGEDPDEAPGAAEEERRRKMLARYEQEFRNKSADQVVKFLNDHWNFIFEGSKLQPEEAETKPVNRNNMFAKKREYGIKDPIAVRYPKIKTKKEDPFKDDFVPVQNQRDIDLAAKNFATTKYNLLEEGHFSWGDQLQNSPHYNEALETFNETMNAEYLYTTGIKETISGISID